MHFMLYHCGLQSARTQTSQPERNILQKYASGQYCVVELGVFEAVTTRVMRQVLHPKGCIYGIDPFPVGRLGFSYSWSISHREVGKAKNGSMSLIRKMSFEAVKDWKCPIDFIFIDADHEENAVTRDWKEWAPKVKRNGFIGFHDSNPVSWRSVPQGPIRLLNKIRATDVASGAYEIADIADSITILRKML